MRVTSPGQEDLVVKPGEGGFQGGNNMAEEFGETYNEDLEEYLRGKRERGRLMFGEDPYWQAGHARESVQQLSLVSFADDVEEMMVAADGAEGTLAEETERFAEIIGTHGMRENREKMRHLVGAAGKGAKARGRLIAQEICRRGLGEVALE